VAAVVAHHPFGNAGGARCIQDVKGVGGRHGHAIRRGSGPHLFDPVQVTAWNHGGRLLGALQDDALVRFMGGDLDGFIQQRFVGNNLLDLDAAGGRYDDFGLGIVDPRGQLIGGKSTEHDGMHGPDAGTGQHGHGGFGNHGHVNQDTVALFHPQPAEDSSDLGHLVPQFGVGIGLDGVGHRAVIDQRRLVAPAVFDVDVQRIVTGVERSAGKPAIERLVAVVQHLVPFFGPGNGLGRLPPEYWRCVSRRAP
jgi:hypothetical protein